MQRVVFVWQQFLTMTMQVSPIGAYIHKHTNAHTHTLAWTHHTTHTYQKKYTQACTHTHACARAHTHTHIILLWSVIKWNVTLFLNTEAHTHTHTCKHTHTHTQTKHTCAHTNTLTHTHTQSNRCTEKHSDARHSPMHHSVFLVVDLNELAKAAGVVVVYCFSIPKSLQSETPL